MLHRGRRVFPPIADVLAAEKRSYVSASLLSGLKGLKAVKRKQCKAGGGICFVPPLVPADGADENNNDFHEVFLFKQSKERNKA